MPIPIESAIPLFHVYDVPAAVRFYRDILGFEIVNTSTPFTSAKDDFGWCLLRLGPPERPVELMLNNAYEDNIRPAAPDPARIAAHADTTLYFACPDLDAAYAHLCAAGIPASAPHTTYYGMTQVNFKDPDGYSLCLQHPTK